jgi:hypothetical protein
MTRFISIYSGPERTTGPTPEEQALIEEGQTNGSLLAGEGCLPMELGALVRRTGDDVTVTDGPYAEAKEVVGGFAIMELGSKEEAVKSATRFLEAVGTDGQCEVRELYPEPALAEEPGRDHRGGGRFLTIFRAVEREEPPSEREMAEMGELIGEFAREGKLIATEGCLPSRLGARVRREGGHVTVTDGPFTESKEIVGGFAILAAESKQEAIELTKRFLAVVGDGESEIRELFTEEALARE